MKRTGVFYHDICGKHAYSSLAMGVEEGFQGINEEGLFSRPNVTWFESQPATEEQIARLHSKEWIENVKGTRWWQVSLYSVGGMIGATEKVLKGEVDNALLMGILQGLTDLRDQGQGLINA